MPTKKTPAKPQQPSRNTQHSPITSRTEEIHSGNSHRPLKTPTITGFITGNKK